MIETLILLYFLAFVCGIVFGRIAARDGAFSLVPVTTVAWILAEFTVFSLVGAKPETSLCASLLLALGPLFPAVAGTCVGRGLVILSKIYERDFGAAEEKGVAPCGSGNCSHAI